VSEERETKLPYCQMPLDLLMNDICFCEWLDFEGNIPVCTMNPGIDCPDFSIYFENRSMDW
jgi:hypothetical protein